MKLAILQPAAQNKAHPIRKLLLAAGHDCVSFESARVFIDQLQPASFDLLLVDAQSPGLNAAEVARLVKEKTEHALPVLLLVDAIDTDGVLAALASGVDDYLIKPVRRQELLARVRVLLRRAWPDSHLSGQIQFGPFRFDTLDASVTLNGKRIGLTQKEFELALLLFRHLGQPVSRATLLETLWTQDADTPSRTVDTHVSRVRSKLGLQAAKGFRLVPVYGYGYLLETVDAGSGE